MSGAGATLLPHRRFTAEGDTYLYAAETGGLFRMDGGVRDALSAFASSGEGAVPPEILSDLRRAGLLGKTGASRPEGRTAHPPLRLRTLVLMLTTSCNLACRYCYEDREEGCVPPEDGRGWPDAAAGGGASREMSPESLRESVGFLLDHSGENRNVSVVLFGGEPLLRFPLLRNAVREARAMARARGKGISFSLTTNGTLVTREIAGFLEEYGVSVCVSIDGPREVHDVNRPYASGRGSYDDVERGIALLMERRNGVPLAARVTLGRGGVDVRKTFRHLRGLGFDEVGFAPASAAEGSSEALTGGELERVLDGFRALAGEYVDDVRERRMPAFSNMTQILGLIHRGDPMPYPCGAGIGMLAADPSGVFYPCHRLCGVGDSMGDPSRGIAAYARARFLDGARRRLESACDACWAKNFCAGGCYHDAYLRQGDLFAPSTHYCRWIRELFLLGLRTYVRIQNETPTFLEVVLGERGIA
ncbi:MAG: radical SAM protein [Deltaproteobacteria bacterium]|nr:radical SAM protein [Deltaproteobacteria bacterium]